MSDITPTHQAAEPLVESAADFKSRLLLEACSMWSGAQKVEAGEIIEWIAYFRAVALHQAAEPAPSDCPHAAPFRYCSTCVVSPCPIGLGEKK
jgi:hypothetical protein